MTNNGFKVDLHFYMKKENTANNLKYLNILLRANICYSKATRLNFSVSALNEIP